jgi:hypothetical protein
VYGGAAALGDSGRESVTALAWEIEAAIFITSLRGVLVALAAHFEQARLSELLAVDLAPVPRLVAVDATVAECAALATADAAAAAAAATAAAAPAATTMAAAAAAAPTSVVSATPSFTPTGSGSGSDSGPAPIVAPAAAAKSAPVEPLAEREARLSRVWSRVIEGALVLPLAARVRSALSLLCRDRDVGLRRKQAQLKRKLQLWGNGERHLREAPAVSTELECERAKWGADWDWG